jgi:hypothetical protein
MICRYCLETIKAHENVSKHYIVCVECNAKIKKKAAYLRDKKRKNKLSTRNSKIKDPVYYYFANARIKHKPFPGDEHALAVLLRQVLRGNRRKRNLISLDHIVPVAHPNVCGLSVSWNLQVLTSFENAEKGNRCNLDAESEYLITYIKMKDHLF